MSEEKQKFEMTVPYYLSKLAAKVGQQKAGNMIGISKSSVNAAVIDQSVRKPMELAAELVWRGTYEVDKEARDDTLLVIVKVPRMEMDTFSRVVNGLGYKHRSFSE